MNKVYTAVELKALQEAKLAMRDKANSTLLIKEIIPDKKSSVLLAFTTVLNKEYFPRFQFYVDKVYQDKHNSENIRFIVGLEPTSESRIQFNKISILQNQLLSQFTNWIKVVQQYFDNDPEGDPIVIGYTKEVYDSFEYIDNDPKKDAITFDLAEQFALLKFLDSFIVILNDNTIPDELSEQGRQLLNCEVNELKENLQYLPRKTFNQRFSKVMGILLKYGRKKVLLILQEAEKYLIKQGLNYVWYRLPMMISKVLKLLDTLPPS